MVGIDEFFDNNFAVPVMAVFRGLGVEKSVSLAITAWGLGIDVIEVPIQTPTDLDALTEVASAARSRGKVAGAGTVIRPEHVHQARDAGAMFAVSPSFDLDMVGRALDAGIPMLPGVATPTEVGLAASFGLTWVKAFPALALGAEWFRAIRGPFPDMKFVATGGLDASNVETFLDGGVNVVGIGSALKDPDQLSQLQTVLAARSIGTR